MKWLIGILLAGLFIVGVGFFRLPHIEPHFRPKTAQKSYHRVISLAPSMSETIKALNQHHRLVGVTTHCQGSDFLYLPKIGSFGEPNFEAIMALKPDLVVAVPHVMATRVLERLMEHDVEVFAHQPDSLEDIKHIITKLAQLFLVPEKGVLVNRQIDISIADAKKKLAAHKPPGKSSSALVVVSFMPFVVAGLKTFPSEIIQEIGFSNQADSKMVPWPIWPLENLLIDPPEVLILGSPEHAQGIKRTFTSLGIRPQHIRLIVPKRPLFNSPSPAIIDDIFHLTTLLSKSI